MNKNETLKGIFLDLDGTLYDYDVCNDYAKEKLFLFLSKKLKKSKGEIKNIFEKSRKVVNESLKSLAASHSRLFYIQNLLETIESKTDVDLILKAHDLFWKEYFKKMKLFEGVESFLKVAKKKGLKIVLLTNLTAEIQFKKIQHLKIEKFIDYVVSSEEAGKEKPFEPVFELALQKVNLKAGEVIMIGDDYQNDIKGAENWGIKSLYFENKIRNKFWITNKPWV